LIFDDLRHIQSRHGYLPAEELEGLSHRTQIPLYRIHGVADFYPHFHLKRPPKVRLNVCSDMACHLRGAPDLKRSLEHMFRGRSDKDVAVGDVSCLGQCDGAPAVSINDAVFRGLLAKEVEALGLCALAGESLPDQSPVDDPRLLLSDPYGDGPRYDAVTQLIASCDWEGAVALLQASGLPGLGGAGFPTGLKWAAVRKARGPEKYVVCNADESEPGTIKDRFILTNLPHLVVEGIIIAGLVTGAQKGFIYIRHEYHAQEKLLRAEIERCYERNLLGSDVLGSGMDFNLEVFVSPGGYICGEETALMEAIEGKRAEPRNKPPFPVEQGLFGKPTALNNVETFANVPQILMRGVDWYEAQGRGGAAGLKFIGISGDVQRPGVFEIPMGLPMSEAIFDLAGGVAGGKQLKAFAPSGPSSGFLPASKVDVPIDFKSLAAAGSMLGSGAIVVYAEGRCMLDAALNAVKFFRNESCGKCVPCRVGTQKMADILRAWTEGRGSDRDLELIQDLTDAMKLTSICGLGQFAPSPLASVLLHFREEILAHLHGRCSEGVCPMREGSA
jgi:formate dehydrogenase beta subunit